MRTALLATAYASVTLVTLAARSQQQVSPEEARGIVRDAYVYAYPLLLHEVGMRQTTNYAEPTGIPGQGPFNQFAHGRAFPGWPMLKTLSACSGSSKPVKLNANQAKQPSISQTPRMRGMNPDL